MEKQEVIVNYVDGRKESGYIVIDDDNNNDDDLESINEILNNN